MRTVRKSSVKALGFFAIVLAVSFITISWYTKGEIDRKYDLDLATINMLEWSLLRNSLALSLNQAKIEGTYKANQIGDQVFNQYNGDLDKIAHALDNYHEPNNFIRTIVTQSLDGMYFNNIHSDNTDPFVTRGEYVETDNSSNCASFGSSRHFDEEYTMHANPVLAEEAFTRIANADLENMNSAAIDRPIFFQFLDHPDGDGAIQLGWKGVPKEHQGKRAQILTSYDIDGLEDYFLETVSWEKTFQAFEFITPSYIFNREDLARRPFIINGRRTEYDRLAVNIVFNFKNVIDHNPILKRDLEKFDWRRRELYNDYIQAERVVYYTIIFLGIICMISMIYTNKLSALECGKNVNGKGNDSSGDHGAV